MYKRFKKYQKDKEKNKDKTDLISKQLESEIASKIDTSKDLDTYRSILQKQNRRTNVKQDDVLVEKWKHLRLGQYLPPAKKIHSILNAINQSSSNGVDFYFMEGAECFYKNQTGVVLFGSVRSKFGKIEAKVFIRNPKRLIFIFPKRGVELDEVETEVRMLLGKDQHVVKFSRVKKKYCFEINLDYRYK